MRAQKQSIFEAYAAQRPRSAELYQRATRVFPSGVTHDSRYLEPFPIYVTHGLGPRKWDVDGHEYIDYFGGHGALLLGHSHPAVVAAVSEQAPKGSHYGACHELEIEWGELIQKIVPSAERVKFVSSGTEATMLALRLIRAYTGRDKVIKLVGHFHGWHDYATISMDPPYDEPVSRGVPKAVQGTVISVPHGDIDALRAAYEANPDAAGVMLLAGGIGTETSTEYLQQVCDVTHAVGGLVVFDEVVTGFRYAAGGCQQYYGVTPDVTTLAKIMAGGYPGGAVVGRADVLALFEHRADPQWMRFGRIRHPGTYNANPVCAAAGVACLKLAGTGQPQATAAAAADRLRAGLRAALERRGASGTIVGKTSLVAVKFAQPKVSARDLLHRFRAAMLVGGVDTSGLMFVVSATHGEAEVDWTIQAFESALRMLQEEGAV